MPTFQENVVTSYSCVEMSGTDYPVTWYYIE